MFAAFATTLMQMTRILMFLVVGFGLNRLRVLPKGAGGGVSKLVTTIFLPALLIYSNMTEFCLADVGSYSRLVLLGLLLWAVATVPSVYIARKLAGNDDHERGVYLYGLSFPNTGAIGTPVILAMMGTAGLFQLNLFILTWVILTYAWGVGLFLNTERKNPVKRFLINTFNPVFISMVIGLSLGALGAKNWMPSIVTEALGDLSACYIPVSLLMAGYTIGDYPLKEVFNRPKSYVFTLLRLVVIPLVAVGIGYFIGVDKMTATLIVLSFASPSGMNVVVFPAAYGRDCKTGASIVLLSSLGAILTVPILYAFVQQIFG